MRMLAIILNALALPDASISSPAPPGARALEIRRCADLHPPRAMRHMENGLVVSSRWHGQSLSPDTAAALRRRQIHFRGPAQGRRRWRRLHAPGRARGPPTRVAHLPESCSRSSPSWTIGGSRSAGRTPSDHLFDRGSPERRRSWRASPFAPCERLGEQADGDEDVQLVLDETNKSWKTAPRLRGELHKVAPAGRTPACSRTSSRLRHDAPSSSSRT